MRNSIKLVRVRPTAILPERKTQGSFGYDVAIPTEIETIDIPAGKTVIIPTGWRLGDELPLAQSTYVEPNGLTRAEDIGGVGMLVLPRSSLPLKYNLIVSNSPGLIDADYTGEIGVIVTNVGAEPTTLTGGTRIAQLVFAFMDFFPIDIVEAPSQTAERGGFGSTGHA